MRFYKLKFSLPWLLFSLGLLIAVLYPIFTHEYLYHDDWHNFAKNCPWGWWFNLQGRPLGGIISCFQFGLFEYIKDAFIARAVSFLCMAALFIAIYEFLLREDYPENLSAFIAFGCLTIPGALVTASYLSTGFIIFSLFASVISALLCQSALKQIAMDKRPYGLITASVLMQIVSASIYQTGAMFFLVPAAAAMSRSFKKSGSLLIRTAFVFGIIFIAANLIYFAGFKYSVAAELARRSPERGTLFHELDYAFIWFFQTVLPRAFSLWFIGKSAGPVPILTGLLFFTSLILYAISMVRKDFSRQKVLLSISYVIVILLMGIVCYLPVLITAHRWNVFRNLIPLSSFIFSVTCIHLWFAYSHWKEHGRAGYLIVFAMIFIAFVSHNVLLNKMILPKSEEVRYVENVMRTAKTLKLDNLSVHVVIPRIEETWSTDEIGLLTTSFYVFGDLYEMISRIRKELELPEVMITYSTAGYYFNPNGRIILDISTIAHAGLSGLAGSYEQNPASYGNDEKAVNPQTSRKHICLSCGHIYDPAKGDPGQGVAPGTAYKNLPDSWLCPVCKSHKQLSRNYCLSCGHVYDPAKGDPGQGVAPGTAYKDLPESWLCPVCKSHKNSDSNFLQ